MKTSDRNRLATLANLSGLDNTERELVTRFLSKLQKQASLNGRDIACIRAMSEKHLRGGLRN